MPTPFDTRKIEMYRDCEQVTRVHAPLIEIDRRGNIIDPSQT